MMLRRLILITLFLSTLETVGAPPAKINQLADGKMSGSTYSHDGLELRAEIPTGWVADADPKGKVRLDSQEPDGPVNRCSKILLSFHSAQPAENGFISSYTLFAVDPACFSEGRLPKRLSDRKKIQQFAEKITKSFSNTPFITRKGADLDADSFGGRLFLILTGDSVIQPTSGPGQTLTSPVHVNTLLCLAESKGYWVMWGIVADDAAKETLKNTKISFRDLR
jgi:hypothetical protein